jgi:hypothetical protein
MTSVEQANKPPKVKLVDLDEQHADTLRMLLRFSAKPYDDPACIRIATNLYSSTGERYPFDHIRQTLFQYKDQFLLPEEVDRLARQLTARSAEWRRGPILPYKGPARAEWVAVEIRSVERAEWKSGKAAQTLGMYCLTGHPAGVTIPKKVPEGWLSFLAYRIGFSRRKTYDYDPRHFLGLRFWAYIRPKDDGYDFEEWEVDSRILKDNKLIIAKRLRFDLEAPINDRQEKAYELAACQYDFQHYCFECTKTARECVASPHRSTCQTTPRS